ncbi:universal stress protein [Pseudomonas fluorescens]|uniref:Universal stress protein n=1 Tax=Pseudomonas fluorescens TaxID=294 RepID=A0A944HD82_PSEFL|nr:universal stress protein [Pseudomonas fluorescens]MBT2297651.1 universal stress protein [Pseudomonas fluorescens]MBT2305850.1 universal stress protein [Pseudomonas fluorescens]MBT2314128.1 universal stress protein [Pseudomonas fluorescens]MBT2319380.1 universal stress protein [Pseudomonas fluorescens]MBT2329202.1 universal stress protein [Pseudomonas fluorescens]
MSQYQRLLLILNPAQRHSPALHHAAALTAASGAHLHVSALVPSLDILSLLEQEPREEARQNYLQDHRHWLEEEADKMRRRGLRVTTQVDWVDGMDEQILQHVTQIQPDLLIKQVQHEPLLKRAFLTPLDWRLLRQCPVPLYLVGGTGHALPRKVVAAVDPSSDFAQNSGLNDRIIREAIGLALQCDAELHLVHAYEVSSVYLGDAGGGGLTLKQLSNELRRSLEKTFLELANLFGVPAERRHFVLGHPVSALSEFALEHEVDVVVMGRSQKSGPHGLLGSTTEHILYQVSCSVLAV